MGYTAAYVAVQLTVMIKHCFVFTCGLLFRLGFQQVGRFFILSLKKENWSKMPSESVLVWVILPQESTIKRQNGKKIAFITGSIYSKPFLYNFELLKLRLDWTFLYCYFYLNILLLTFHVCPMLPFPSWSIV